MTTRIFAVYHTGQRHPDYGYFPQPGGVNILRDRWTECCTRYGFDAAWWHNPYGVKANADGSVDTTKNMSIEARLDAEAEGFKIEVGRVTREVLKATGKPFTHYYGTRPDGQDAPVSVTSWVQNVRKYALAESLASGARIALDSVVDDTFPEMVALTESLHRSRRLAGIEGWPRDYAPHLCRYPQIVTSENWQRIYGWPHDKTAPLNTVRGERIVLMNNWTAAPGEGPGIFNTAKFPNAECVTPAGGWLWKFARLWIDSGWSIALPGELFRSQGINVKAWLKGITT